ncbi:MAG: hypothetical protein ACRDF0_10900 [Candidatus Limnocylindria bacterium]
MSIRQALTVAIATIALALGSVGVANAQQACLDCGVSTVAAADMLPEAAPKAQVATKVAAVAVLPSTSTASDMGLAFAVLGLAAVGGALLATRRWLLSR